MSRYERQTRFAPFGEEGQQKLSSLKYLFWRWCFRKPYCRSTRTHGAHHIAIVDMDIVEISNLHRQTLFDEEDAHTLISKVEAIKHKVNQININVNLTTYDLEVTSSNIENLIKMSNQTSSLMAWITSKYDT